MSDFSVGSGQQIARVDVGNLNETQQMSVAKGISAQKGAVPSTVDKAFSNTPVNSAVLDQVLGSLAKFTDGMTGEEIDILILDVTSKMRDLAKTSEGDRLALNQEKKRSALAEKQEKMEKAAEKAEEAAAQEEEGPSVWGIIKGAIMATVGALMIAAGAIVAIAASFSGVGILAGGALAAMGTVTLGLAVDSIVSEIFGQGIMGMVTSNLAEAMGADEELAAKIGNGFDIATQVTGAVIIAVIAAAMIIVPVAQFAAAGLLSSFSGMISSIISNIVSLATTGVAAASGSAAATGAGAVATSASLASKIATGVKVTMNLVQAATTLTTAAGDTVVAVKEHKAEQTRADAKDAQADSKDSEAITKMIDELLERIMAAMSESSDRFNVIFSDLSASINDRNSSLSRARFSA